MTPTEWLRLTDEELARHCEEDRYRASGPGGQKRNKTDSAIRLRHLPTGLVVTAVESRSQHENRRRALRRMREALAFQIRSPIDDVRLDAIRQSVVDGRLSLRDREPSFLTTAAGVLDLFAQHESRLSTTADALGISTGNLVRFLREHDDGWQAAQYLRQLNGQPLLKQK